MSEKVSEDSIPSSDAELPMAPAEQAADADADAADADADAADADADAADADAAAATADAAVADADAADADSEIEIEVDTTEDEPDPVAVLQARVDELIKDKDDTYSRLLRTTADLDNFRKRSRRDVQDAGIEAKKSVLTDMLPVIDNLERALEHSQKADGGQAETIIDGVKLVLRQFVQAFERASVSSFESIGQPFDPNVHEAVGQIETADHPPGAVAQELQRGYTIGERLLRPSMVVVAKAPVEPEPEETGANGHDKGNGLAGTSEAAEDADSAPEPEEESNGDGSDAEDQDADASGDES